MYAVFGLGCCWWGIGFPSVFLVLLPCPLLFTRFVFVRPHSHSRHGVWDSTAVASVPPYLHLHQPTMPETEQHTPSYLTDRKWHFKSLKSACSRFLFLLGSKQDFPQQVVLDSTTSLTAEYENRAGRPVWLRDCPVQRGSQVCPCWAVSSCFCLRHSTWIYINDWPDPLNKLHNPARSLDKYLGKKSLNVWPQIH